MTMANQPTRGGTRLRRVYPAEVTARLQTLLATLADLDLAFESDLATIQSSSADEPLKQQVLERLREHHRARRAPYLRELARLEQRIVALAA